MVTAEWGPLITRATIWVALALYGLSVTLLLRRRRTDDDQAARLAWTLACGAFLGHVAAAFVFYFDGSHAAALEHTARRTMEVVGFRFAPGLYVNYFFTVFWLADVAWWWLAPNSYRNRPWRVHALVHGFFVFMIVNGAIVFASGPIRPLATVAGLGLLAMAWRTRGKQTR
jgi:hypothetical protein